MKWLLLIFSIFRPFFGPSGEHKMGNPIAELKEVIKENAMKVVGIFAAVSALATIFAAGIVIIAVDIGAQYDQNAYVYFSSMIMMGLTLSLLSLIIIAIAAKAVSNANAKPVKREVLQSVGTSHPLQDALALLIHDFVKEREMKRAKGEEATTLRPHRTTDDEHYHSSENPMH